MRKIPIVLAAALVATAAFAAEEQKPKPPANSNQPPSADSQKSETGDPAGYGYGEQPGGEAKDGGAGQASAPGRARSKAPQDERPTSGREAEGKDHAVSGRVTAVAPGRVSVRNEDGKEESLRVTKQTVVLRYGQRIDATRLRPGDEVRASLGGQGAQRVATRITVHGADSAMQQGRPGGESVDTPDQAREGIGGHMENTRPEPERAGPEGPPTGR